MNCESSDASTIPHGHFFIDFETFVSAKGNRIADKLLAQTSNRTPDIFGMYIYDDFFHCAVIELVDTTLTTLRTKIKKKEWEKAYHILEGLLIFFDFEFAWANCKDENRVKISNKVIGACAIALFRGLDCAGQLDSTRFPSLENLLTHLDFFSEHMNHIGYESEYGSLCKGIARRLFQDKSEANLALHVKRLKEWASSLDADREKEVEAKIKKLVDENSTAAAHGLTVKPWYAKGEVHDEDDKSPDFNLSHVWKCYKEYLAGIPRLPLNVPAEWDLTKWTAAERKEFVFMTMTDDEFDDEDFL